MTIDRRNFLKKSALFGAGAAAMQVNPDWFFTSARAQSGKPLVFYSAENLTGNWDPSSHTTLAQINLEGFVFGTLTRAPMSPEDPSELRMELATELNPLDKYTLEVKLRDDVTFHDGEPFTARDVKATYEYASQPDRPAAWYPGQCKVEVVDDYTCHIKTEEYDYPASLYVLLSSFLPIMAAKDIESGRISEKPNGTGPFRFARQEGDDSILESFPDYFKGAPKLPQITFSFVGDGTTRALALMNGEADLIERLEPEQVETLEQEDGIKMHKAISVENKYLWFRCSKPPFDNELLRKAACHAIDRDILVEVLGDAGHASYSHISPVKFGYTEVENYPEFDPERCQQLLAEAGFPNGEGLPEMEYITSVGFYPKTKEYGEIITSMLQAQGFPVRLNVMEVAAWNERLYDRPGGGPGHMIDCGWSTGSPEPDLVLRTHFHSSSKRITGIEDEELDASLDKERNAETVEEREQILKQETLPLIAEKAPALSLFTSVFIHAMRDDLEGLFIYPNGQMDASEAEFS